MLTDSIGYVSLSQYTRNCARDVRQAMTQLKEQGARTWCSTCAATAAA